MNDSSSDPLFLLWLLGALLRAFATTYVAASVTWNCCHRRYCLTGGWSSDLACLILLLVFCFWLRLASWRELTAARPRHSAATVALPFRRSVASPELLLLAKDQRIDRRRMERPKARTDEPPAAYSKSEGANHRSARGQQCRCWRNLLVEPAGHSLSAATLSTFVPLASADRPLCAGNKQRPRVPRRSPVLAQKRETGVELTARRHPSHLGISSRDSGSNGSQLTVLSCRSFFISENVGNTGDNRMDLIG